MPRRRTPEITVPKVPGIEIDLHFCSQSLNQIVGTPDKIANRVVLAFLDKGLRTTYEAFLDLPYADYRCRGQSNHGLEVYSQIPNTKHAKRLQCCRHHRHSSARPRCRPCSPQPPAPRVTTVLALQDPRVFHFRGMLYVVVVGHKNAAASDGGGCFTQACGGGAAPCFWWLKASVAFIYSRPMSSSTPQVSRRRHTCATTSDHDTAHAIHPRP